jgi:hypothetical protein
MSRRILTTALETTTGNGVVDTYFDRVVKFIPADIIGAWIAASSIVKSSSGIPTNTVLWICFVFGVIITPAWTLKQTNFQSLPPARLQALVATAAFVVWVFALGDPFSALSFYHQVYGSLVLIAFTLISGGIVPSASPRVSPVR